MSIYIARDNDGSLWLYEIMPVRLQEHGVWIGQKNQSYKLSASAFPDIKPGECVEFESKGAVT